MRFWQEARISVSDSARPLVCVRLNYSPSVHTSFARNTIRCQSMKDRHNLEPKSYIATRSRSFPGRTRKARTSQLTSRSAALADKKHMALEPPQLAVIAEKSRMIEPRVVAFEDEQREIPGLDLLV